MNIGRRICCEKYDMKRGGTTEAPTTSKIDGVMSLGCSARTGIKALLTIFAFSNLQSFQLFPVVTL